MPTERADIPPDEDFVFVNTSNRMPLIETMLLELYNPITATVMAPSNWWHRKRVLFPFSDVFL
ncbi:hypothetical protein GGQ84_002302 [Desulfitispora alkaliphila]|uniref:hypothetical protein n=1 Tax=Desulfitispora alkaliphila TaxID=622674 RepID=UPI003D21A125